MAEPKWWYAQGGARKGPVPLAALQALVGRGEVTAKDLVWREGMPGWVAAATVAELTAAAVAPQAAPPAPAEQAADGVPSPAASSAAPATSAQAPAATEPAIASERPAATFGPADGATAAPEETSATESPAAEEPAGAASTGGPETAAAVAGSLPAPAVAAPPAPAAPPPAVAPAAAAEPAPGTGDAFWADLLFAVRSVAFDPLAGQRTVYQQLGRFRSMQVGAALLGFWAVVTVFSGVAIAWKGAAATRAAESFGFMGFLRLVLFVVLAPIVGVGAMGLLRRVAKGVGSLDSDIFLTGVATLPLALMTALLPMLGFSTFVAVGVEAFAAVLSVIVLLAGQTRVVGLTERAAAWGVPLTVALVAAVVATLLEWLL